jgi:hypothetical protein
MVDGDVPDPLLWWLPGVLDPRGGFHGITASAVEAVACEQGQQGVRVLGAYEDRTIERVICTLPDGRFRAVTRALTALHPNEQLAEDLVVGTAPAIIERVGMTWDTGGHNHAGVQFPEEPRETNFVALAEHNLAVVLATPDSVVRRRPIRIAAESFPSPITVSHREGPVTQFIDVRAGDALDALAVVPAAQRRSVQVAFEQGHQGAISLLDANAKVLAAGALVAGPSRTLSLPSDFAASVAVRDERGLRAVLPLAAGNDEARVAVPAIAAGVLRLRYHAPQDQPLPVHVLIRGIAPTPDPEPAATAPDQAQGNSLYLLRGQADVSLPVGRYKVTATHGFTYTLSTREVTVGPEAVTVSDELHPAFDTSAYTSGDFHLHSAPSPDSSVSLEARVLSLLAEGVDFAVATDHNRITDFAPAARALNASDTIATMVGNEITTGGRLWGHFNAFPLLVPPGAQEDGVSVYFQQTPASVFAAARDAGASVIQVNHGRMPPSIGYFDLTQLDSRTGRAQQVFANDFNAVEAFNGIWLETPAKVREGLRDVVGLVRRGLRPALTGNSDSHTLLFEEAGYPRTFVRTPPAPINTRGERVVQALLAGQTTVSSGPLVELTVQGQGPGAVVRPAQPVAPGGRGTVNVHVRVLAASWVAVEHVEIWRDDQVVQRIDVPGPAVDGLRFERDIELSLVGDATITAWADADTPLPEVLPYPHARAIGFAGLVYVDLDGDGTVQIARGRAAETPELLVQGLDRPEQTPAPVSLTEACALLRSLNNAAALRRATTPDALLALSLNLRPGYHDVRELDEDGRAIRDFEDDTLRSVLSDVPNIVRGCARRMTCTPGQLYCYYQGPPPHNVPVRGHAPLRDPNVHSAAFWFDRNGAGLLLRGMYIDVDP